jgi:hypothetical protein
MKRSDGAVLEEKILAGQGFFVHSGSDVARALDIDSRRPLDAVIDATLI